jgi:hypothetical protein
MFSSIFLSFFTFFIDFKGFPRLVYKFIFFIESMKYPNNLYNLSTFRIPYQAEPPNFTSTLLPTHVIRYPTIYNDLAV